MNKLKQTLALLSFATLYLVHAQPAQATGLARTWDLTMESFANEVTDFTLTEDNATPAPAPAPAPAPKRHTKKKRSSSTKYEGKHSRHHRSHSRRTAGGSGFSYERMEVAESIPSLIKTIINHGQELLGLRYRTSGVAKWPLDCSGFVSYICSLEGIKTPRSSGSMSLYTDRISDPQPGDLLFFKGRNRGASRVGHVAMVISNENGDIKMIHSSNSRGIVIESLQQSAYFSSRYLGAGRLPEVKEHWDKISSTAPASLN